MKDTQIIIFSKNRALQLDALLQTLQKFAPHFVLDVIYIYDDAQYYKGYEILKREHSGVRFHKESIFEKDVLGILKKTKSKYLCFMCDDDLLFKDINLPEDLIEDALCFSLRLGENTTYCFNFAKNQNHRGQMTEGFLVWKWKKAEWDFAYPMSVDGHIFRTSDIKTILQNMRFKDPFDLENNMTIAIHKISLGDERPKIMAMAKSVLVGIPDNKVSSRFPFPHAGGSLSKLNEMYLEGKRIKPFEMDYTNVKGAHQIIPFVIS